jgi:hypothetical protein
MIPNGRKKRRLFFKFLFLKIKSRKASNKSIRLVDPLKEIRTDAAVKGLNRLSKRVSVLTLDVLPMSILILDGLRSVFLHKGVELEDVTRI